MANPDRILIVEDEELLLRSLRDLFEHDGFEVDAVTDLAGARSRLGESSPSLVLLDLALPDGSGLDLLEALTAEPTGPAVVVLTGDSALDTAVTAVRRGAHDFLAKPFTIDVLRHRVSKALENRAAGLVRLVQQRQGSLYQVGSGIVPLPSQAMRAVHETLTRVGQHDITPVLVTGETGVGKESVCRALHAASPRCREPFIAVNCAELDRALLRSELFGHERGAFTGATDRRVGLFELATRGSLMLDEVAELSPEVQGLFLRVLEDGWFRRLGGTRELKTDARVIAVTNKPLEELVRQGSFRSDLLFRLNAAEIRVPPLRERPDDVVELARHFCRRRARALGREIELTDSAVARLLEYSWPGNIRELRSVIDRSLLAAGAERISADHLDLRGTPPARPVNGSGGDWHSEDTLWTLEEMERRYIGRVLERTEGNRSRAAELLGIARSTLARKLEGV